MTSTDSRINPVDECEKVFKNTLATLSVPAWYAESVKNSRTSSESDTHLHRRFASDNGFGGIGKNTSIDEPGSSDSMKNSRNPAWRSGTISTAATNATPIKSIMTMISPNKTISHRKRTINIADIHWPDRCGVYRGAAVGGGGATLGTGGSAAGGNNLNRPGSSRSRTSLSSAGFLGSPKGGYVPGCDRVAQTSRWYKPKNLSSKIATQKQVCVGETRDNLKDYPNKSTMPLVVNNETTNKPHHPHDSQRKHYQAPPDAGADIVEEDDEASREIMNVAPSVELSPGINRQQQPSAAVFVQNGRPAILTDGHKSGSSKSSSSPEMIVQKPRIGATSPLGQNTSTDDSCSFHTCLMADHSSSSMYMSAREMESSEESTRSFKTAAGASAMTDRYSHDSQSTLMPYEDSTTAINNNNKQQTIGVDRQQPKPGLYDNITPLKTISTHKTGLRKYCGRLNFNSPGDQQKIKHPSSAYCHNRTALSPSIGATRKFPIHPLTPIVASTESSSLNGMRHGPSPDIAILKQLVARIGQTFAKHEQVSKDHTNPIKNTNEKPIAKNVKFMGTTHKSRPNAGIEEFNDIVKKILQFPNGHHQRQQRPVAHPVESRGDVTANNRQRTKSRSTSRSYGCGGPKRHCSPCSKHRNRRVRRNSSGGSVLTHPLLSKGCCDARKRIKDTCSSDEHTNDCSLAIKDSTV